MWGERAVRVRVPATSANLGPGFDALGLALTLYDDVEASVTRSGLSVEVSGAGQETAEAGERHLVVRAFRATFARIAATGASGGENPGEPRRAPAPEHSPSPQRPPGHPSGPEQSPGLDQPPGLRLRCVNRIPHGRGLGSSAAATVAGILAARALHPYGTALDDQAVFALASEIEGHPDNAAPCLAGGLTIAWLTESGPRMLRLPVGEGITPVVFVPEGRLSTEKARGLLPETVRHADAAWNAGRSALLVAALTTGQSPDVLLDATGDRLHQDYRAAAMQESAELLRRLRKSGVPAVISGAGPSVLAFTTTAQVDSIAPELGNGWHKHPLNVASHGAQVQLTGS